jgi:twitching motility two-component system response regulator PilG
MSKLVHVIDNSLIVRKILEVCLHREGYEVNGFHDGTLAMQWFAAPQVRIPDLVFVEPCLPKIGGYELIRDLKARPLFGRTVFVIISRSDGVIDKLKGRFAGASAYLRKPLKTGEIIAVVQAYLGVCVPGSEYARADR